jgi:hypothetical protein
MKLDCGMFPFRISSEIMNCMDYFTCSVFSNINMKVAHMGEERDAHRGLVGKPDWKRPLGYRQKGTGKHYAKCRYGSAILDPGTRWRSASSSCHFSSWGKIHSTNSHIAIPIKLSQLPRCRSGGYIKNISETKEGVVWTGFIWTGISAALL